MNTYKIETKNLSKKFKNNVVLNDINLKVAPNEVYGLLGINGAGKSTLLKIICGILSSSHGEIFLDGAQMVRNDLSNIGSLIESPPTYNHLNAYDNLKIVALNENIPFDNIPQVLKKVKLKVDKQKKVKDFSLGMKQRLGIAMALIKKTKVINTR